MRIRDLPFNALLMLIPAVVTIALMILAPQLMPIGDTVFERIFYGWTKDSALPNITGVAVWLVLLAPCWAFTANITQQECGPRLYMMIYRKKSKLTWYLNLCAVVTSYSVFYLLAIAALAVMADSLTGVICIYNASYITAYMLLQIFLLMIVMLSVQAQLFTGRTKTGFVAPFILLLLPEVPIGMWSQSYARMPWHFPMYIRSDAVNQTGFNIPIAITTLFILLALLYLTGFYTMDRVTEKIGG